MRIKLSSIKRGARHYLSMKAARKKLGLTGASRHFRQFKRGISGLTKTGSFASSQPVSASTVYQHKPRTLSQLTGGVYD